MPSEDDFWKLPAHYAHHRPYSWFIIYFAKGTQCCALGCTVTTAGRRESKYLPLW